MTSNCFTFDINFKIKIKWDQKIEDDFVILAIWPSPIEICQCYQTAGFKDFLHLSDYYQNAENPEDIYDLYSFQFETLLKQIIKTIESIHGNSKRDNGWWSKMFKPIDPFDQLMAPIYNDSLGFVNVDFKNEKNELVRILTGNSHDIIFVLTSDQNKKLLDDTVETLQMDWEVSRHVLDPSCSELGIWHLLPYRKNQLFLEPLDL